MIDLARTCARFRELFGEMICLDPIYGNTIPLNVGIRGHFKFINGIVNDRAYARYELALVMLVYPLLARLRHVAQAGQCLLVMDINVKYPVPKNAPPDRYYPEFISYREYKSVTSNTMAYVLSLPQTRIGRIYTSLFTE